MAEAVGSTSAAGSARKRVRKRTRKSKSNTTAHDDSDAESLDTPHHTSAPVTTTPSEPARVAAASVPAPAPVAVAAPKKMAKVAEVNPHKPSFITRPTAPGGRRYTVSVAIPGSIVVNAQSPELQSRLAAHIARACAIFNVDEIVVFDEGDVRSIDPDAHAQQRPAPRGNKRRWSEPQSAPHEGEGEGEEQQEESENKGFDPQTFLARVLQYLETPQYLRKALFPMHRDLRLAGLMPPLDCPHHLRFEDECEYREGVTVDPPHWARGRGQGVYVNIGLRDPIQATLPGGVPARVETGTRVTVKMPYTVHEAGEIVSPREPVEKLGWYWGYTVRLAPSLSAVLTDCPFGSEYDLVIGTSERGVSLTDLALATSQATPVATPEGQTVQPLAKPQHALIVFGGLSGLELAVEADQGIQLDRNNAAELFDAWVNVVDNQGSRTVRSEEAIMIALARVKPILDHLAAAK
ncbi:uncharacterized protein PAN0_014c4994 [Moesziomyces antarcticus]|uniref:Uncharacterized protein n=2 Tax=Pseudozyma antarctica TaxID=84753 RepID=A0A081CJC4_PSEA2|nr:uncharacterized protein PAN0_014c4994 [Moesziomyces antarcticus]GAK66770.1 conserved hypothetical protein [Moesziomyces antarcticus]SPO47819.1 uncharacterized protein PSANT_05507 [Moesziomyces antarcticus]